jgi:hypothetical protein
MLNQNTLVVITVISGILNGCYLTFLFDSIFLLIHKTSGMLRVGPETRSPLRRALNVVWLITKWPALVYLLTDPVFHLMLGHKLDAVWWFGELLGLWNWWHYRNIGDDDDWQKLKKKVKEKIAVLGSKLVVIPEPA